VDQKSRFCSQCQKQTLWARPGTNHLLHLLMSILTCGLWLPIWIWASVRIGGWKCQSCGHDGFEDSSLAGKDGYEVNDDQDQFAVGAVKGGLLGGSVAGFLGLLMAAGGSAEVAVGIVAFLGIAGLVIGAAIGAYYEKHYA
jgi:hypothetical protein